MNNLKYSLNINQQAIIENNLQVDLIDAVIFSYLKDYANSPNCQRLKEDSDYFLVKWNDILSALPMLRITTRQNIHKHLVKLKNANLIEPYIDNQIMGQSWYRFDFNSDKLN